MTITPGLTASTYKHERTQMKEIFEHNNVTRGLTANKQELLNSWISKGLHYHQTSEFQEIRKNPRQSYDVEALNNTVTLGK